MEQLNVIHSLKYHWLIHWLVFLHIRSKRRWLLRSRTTYPVWMLSSQSQ